MRSFSIYGGLGVVLALSGCSLINSFDSVKPANKDAGTSGATGGAGGKSGAGGKDSAGGASTTDASSAGGATGDTGGTTGGGGGGTTGAGGGTTATDGGDAGFVPGGPGGAIVGFSNGALVVIDPVDGKQLSSEAIGTIKTIAHDPLTDTWFIFEAGAKPVDPAVLHVRQLRVTDGKWNELSKVTVAQPALRATTLNSRVAYLSVPPGQAQDQNLLQLTILNTEDLKKVAPVTATAQTLPVGQKTGVIGLATAAGVGGTVDVAYVKACVPQADGGPGECEVDFTRFTVGAGTSIVQGTPQAVGSILGTGTAPFAFDPTNGGSIVMIFPALVTTPNPVCGTYTTTGHVQKINIQTLQSQAPVDFNIYSDRFSGGAYDQCLDVAFAQTSLSDPAIWAIPMGGGTVKKTCTGASTSMQVEPYTRTLIRLIANGNPEFRAIEGTAAAPTLRQVTLPKLPPTFAPSQITVRQPAAVVCPK